jgi:hypothetical protein
MPVMISLLCLLPLLGSCSGATVSASYRKDVYLPEWKESIPDPVPLKGGRVHIVVANSNCTRGPLSSVKVNGIEALGLAGERSDDDPDFTYFDWAKADADSATGTVWIGFHRYEILHSVDRMYVVVYVRIYSPSHPLTPLTHPFPCVTTCLHPPAVATKSGFPPAAPPSSPSASRAAGRPMRRPASPVAHLSRRGGQCACRTSPLD